MNFFDYIKRTPYEFHEKYIQTDLVNVQHHATFPLDIYCYGREAVHGNVWDDVTSKCRGIIVNRTTGEIVARPFEKFHNYGTNLIMDSFEIKDWPQPVIWEKLDGFLCTLYTWEGVDYIASKGSFHSIHAKWATAWYRKHIGESADWNGFTPVFEGLHRDLRIVVDYGKREELVLLSLINIETGAEVRPETLIAIGVGRNLKTPELIDMTWQRAAEETLKSYDDGLGPDEGFVLTWYDPLNVAPPFRLKLKYVDYCRLHRAVCGVSPKRVWEALSTPHLAAELKDWTSTGLPWFSKFINQWVGALQTEFNRLRARATELFCSVQFGLEQFSKDNWHSPARIRKAYAEEFTKAENKEFSGILFSLLDAKDTDAVIWKQVKRLTANGHPLRDAQFT